MRVTQVGIRPTEATLAAGRPTLTPELLAASGARYSRNNEGLEAILSKIDLNNLDKSVDSIFRMIDYGHQSIADMVPVSMFIDDISIWLAYYVWSLCPTAGGQESSTRYIKLTIDGLIDAEQLGIPTNEIDSWSASMEVAFEAYLAALTIWEDVTKLDPEATRIPKSLLEDTSERAQRQVERMRRNFAFDRARYFLPVAAATNMMLLMSARGWTQLCQHLLSHPLPEPQYLGKLIRDELELCAPRMLRHVTAKTSYKKGLQKEFEDLCRLASTTAVPCLEPLAETFAVDPIPRLDLLLPDEYTSNNFSDDMEYHDNRYAWIGPSLRDTAVRFGWDAVAFAEIRDLNRHRTGSKSCPMIPLGFYSAEDKLAKQSSIPEYSTSQLHQISKKGRDLTKKAFDSLVAGRYDYIYWTLLGTQYKFNHLTSADKFIYEAELRTGSGAHFRYAQHFKDILALWYEQYPNTKGLVLEGSAEPE